ncbi:hypothetical protein [Candidatus Accumulibacter sp. ACC007]|uniref:hypothetical protein n=1 Tax=Candidatus Accumulibacter sp. ACC007 TaxID=2823333 RepID=UPI0025BE7303|nr:hypothetical protein [Candidatus Accumulibacter sp. ACC007]
MKKRLLSISVIFLVATIAACGNHEQEVKNKAVEQRLLTEKVLAKVKAEAKAKVKEEAEVKAEAEAKVEAEARIQPSSCVAAMDEQKERYKKLTAQKKYWEAATTVRSCAAILNDPTLKTMLADAEVRNYIALINDKRSEAQSRLIALDSFLSDYPDQAIEFKKRRLQLAGEAERENRDSEVAATKSAVATRKRDGVSLGMSEEDAIASSWGKPRHINRTQTSYGTSEQWVYGNGNYLYFTDGKLTRIQN